MTDKNKGPTRLTDKQERFAIAVAEGKNQSDAYRSAYNAENMTDKTINESASRLMADHKVSTRIEKLRAKVVDNMVKKAIVTVEDTLQAYLKIRDTCMAELEITSKTGDKLATQLVDANAAKAANDSIAKYLGMFVEKVEHSGEIKMPTIIIGK
jgi:phage terminase small subunit